jgi:hypothetical protein
MPACSLTLSGGSSVAKPAGKERRRRGRATRERRGGGRQAKRQEKPNRQEWVARVIHSFLINHISGKIDIAFSEKCYARLTAISTRSM